VAAIEDPNPVVSGSGFRRLREAGVEVTVGQCAEEVRDLNEAYWIATTAGRPFVALKMAMSLDGKIAAAGGASKWITGEAARRHVHRLRAKFGAVLAGIGTVLADDPLLTARFRGVPRQPVRVVVDPSARMPLGCQLARTARVSPVFCLASPEADKDRVAKLREAGVQTIAVEIGAPGRMLVGSLLRTLRNLGVGSVLVEGGAGTYAPFLESATVDAVYAYLAPIVIGGQEALSAVGAIGVREPTDARRFEWRRAQRLGDDILLEARPPRSLE
jgi:diaminohydroxyphosphoribosylaminopyrimidine deaminase/5-amino-6-(5-phosphoribosylamino)uracil reductase